MEIRGLNNKDELTELFDVYKKVFKKTPLRYFENRLLNDPYFVPQDVRVAIEDGRIVSTVTVYRRKMYWKGQTIPFGGIGNVATLPEHGGKGLSTKVMKDALKYMGENGLPLSILFTGINGFYERFGFQTAPAWRARFFVPETVPAKFEIRKFKPTDFEPVQQLYRRFNRNKSGALLREPAYWRANLLFAEENELFLVAEAGTIEAYMRLVPGNPKGEIWEFAYSDVHAFVQLLFSAAQRLKKNTLETAALIPKNFFDQALPVKVEYEPSEIAMYKILQPDMRETADGFAEYCFWWTDNF